MKWSTISLIKILTTYSYLNIYPKLNFYVSNFSETNFTAKYKITNL